MSDNHAPYRTGAKTERRCRPSKAQNKSGPDAELAERRAETRRRLTMARDYAARARDQLCAAVLFATEAGNDEITQGLTADRDFTGHTIAKIDAALAVKHRRPSRDGKQPREPDAPLIDV